MHRFSDPMPMPHLPIDGWAPQIAPPLKWAGGKRWLVPKLKTLVAGVSFDRLVEPFVGGLGVTLGLMPAHAYLADANQHLINFYRWLQRGISVKRSGVRFENDRAVFFSNRDRFNELVAKGRSDYEEAAALFYYLNRTAYNGLCRFNRKGFFNVPFGGYKMIAYRTDFKAYKLALSAYVFQSGDFANIELRRGDLIYADPPYDVPFRSYSANGFTWSDQVRLAGWLANQNAPVIASNQATERVLKLYRSHGFRITKLLAPRRISCDGNRDDALEMLATNGL